MKIITEEQGSALVITLMATSLLTALGVALVLTTSTETMISANYRASQQAFYAADAGLERSMQDLIRSTNWNGVLGASGKSTFVDSAGDRTAPDGTTIDLTRLTADLQSETNALYGSDPNRPLWRLYAHSPISRLLGVGITTRGYVVVWIADDPAETDGDPTLDTNGVVAMRAEAFGERGSRKAIEAVVSQSLTTLDPEGYLGQRGQSEQGRRFEKGNVQTPGETVTEMRMDLSSGGMVVQ